MKLLFISNLFPDAAEPIRGLDNGRLLRELAKRCEVRVLALRPTPGFPPFWRPRHCAPRREDEALSPLFRPVPYLPKIGSRVNHRLMAGAIRKTIQEIRASFSFDRVLCAWVYPDGCAVARLARELGFKFVVVAQGSDVHQYLRMPARRRIIVPAMNSSSGVVARSRELARLLAEAGVEENRLQTIYNGVDFDCFRPGDRRQTRIELNLPLEEPMILFVGNFLPIKNPLLMVDSHAELCRRQPDRRYHLVMLGEGPLREAIQRRARAAGTSQWLLMPGRQPLSRVSLYMQAADVLCLSSENEGVPNVVLEAFACGLRVVATRVGGISEGVDEDFLGQLVPKGDAPALAEALAATIAEPAQRERILRHASVFSWERAAGQYLKALDR